MDDVNTNHHITRKIVTPRPMSQNKCGVVTYINSCSPIISSKAQLIIISNMDDIFHKAIYFSTSVPFSNVILFWLGTKTPFFCC